MTEPVLDRGDTWEDYRERQLTEKASVEVALSFDLPWWERDAKKVELAQLWFAIDCAERHIGMVYDDL